MERPSRQLKLLAVQEIEQRVGSGSDREHWHLVSYLTKLNNIARGFSDRSYRRLHHYSFNRGARS